MSPCGGECRRVSCWSHAAARWPVVAGARRRSSAPPASPVRHQQTIATNKRSTSAAARRPPAAPQSAAQAAGAARAPRRSISHAHRSPQARAGESERCHKPPQRSCLNRGAVAHHRLARAAPPAPSSALRPRARARGFGASGLTRVRVACCNAPAVGRDRGQCCARKAKSDQTEQYRS